MLGGRFPVRSTFIPDTQTQYGYDQVVPSSSVTLYYENEPGRTQPITLPAGTYNCRFLITEESFHNPVNSTPEGGYWKTVLASEDLLYDAAGNIIGHDTNTANDVVFTIGSRPESRQMKASVSMSVAQPKADKYQATVQITVSDILGRGIRDAKVIGYWTGLHRTTGISATANSTGIGGTSSRSDGVVQLTTPVFSRVGRKTPTPRYGR
ncbi:hypothetical protein FM036_44755 [Nostoc sp. HG1]|nr:hypothetical protein [Nostoc sp. HG1]